MKLFSSSEDEFDFLLLLKNEITSMYVTLGDREEESSNEDSDKVRGVKRRKIRVIE